MTTTETGFLVDKPYLRAAPGAVELGYSPVPVGGDKVPSKSPPLFGYTGYGGCYVDEILVRDLAMNHGGENVAFRLPRGVVTVVGIDVDVYHDGDKTLAEVEKTVGAALPETVMSTARDDGSGVRLYQVPEGTVMDGLWGAGIEIVQWFHRFCMAPPSTNPKTSTVYRWIRSVSPYDEVELIPASELPLLPQGFIDYHVPGTGGSSSKGTNGKAKAKASSNGSAKGIGQAWLNALPDEEPCTLVQAVQDKWVSYEESGGADGARYPGQVNGTWQLVRLWAEGHQGVGPALEALRAAYEDAVSEERPDDWKGEWNRSLDGAVLQLPAERDENGCFCDTSGWREMFDGPVDAEDEAPGQNGHASGNGKVDPLAGLWEKPEFSVLHQWARARMVSPEAVLLVALARVLATVPSWVVLPPFIGGGPGGSLNMFVGIAGPSQAGKDAAMDAAASAVQLPEPQWKFTQEDDPHPYSVPLGSGEGLAHQYAHRVRRKASDDPKDKRTVSVVLRTRESVIFEVSEVGTLTKTSNRSGSTIMENLCVLWTGKTLGQANADPERRIPVMAHTYRAVLLLGVQPRKAGPLFEEEDGGLPQRIVWADAIDPGMPEPTPGGQTPPSAWVVPNPEWNKHRKVGQTFLVLQVPGEVEHAVRQTRWRLGSGKETGSYAGHLMFTREKLMVAVALYLGRRDPTLEDWDIAGLIIQRSEMVRAEVQAAVQAVKKEAAHGAGIAKGHMDVAARSVIHKAENVAHAKQIERVRKRILAAFGNGVSLARADVRRQFSRYRDDFDEAWADLVDRGLLILNGKKWRQS